MHWLDLTLGSPEENLALDEALLATAEAEGPHFEVLRLWEAPRPAVVLGRSSCAAREANLDVCRAQGIPVLRRASGGAAVMIGPGCLMYALVLSYERRPELRSLAAVHGQVLDRFVMALRPHVPTVARQGTSDLAFQPPGANQAPRKFSGNSLRCRRTHVLYHGTLLYAFPLALLPTYLGAPAREPSYRAARTHAEFVANAPLSGGTLRSLVREAWQPGAGLTAWPNETVAQLVRGQYGRAEWNFSH